jgi:hypothetical protein
MVGPPSWVVMRLEDMNCWTVRPSRFVATWHPFRLQRRHTAPFPTCSSTSSLISPPANGLSPRSPEYCLPGVRLRTGGEMLFTIALVLLALWLLGLVGVYRVGDLFHVFLLIGLMFLLLGFLRAREAALRASVGETKKSV